MSEIWKDVHGFECDYEVSSYGRIGSKRNQIILKPQNQANGYKTVNFSVNGNTTKKFIHIAVLESFIGFRPYLFEACHNDGNSSNNYLCNLRWDSKKNNQKDRLRHGTSPRGGGNGCAKLSEYDIMYIRSHYERFSYNRSNSLYLAKKFNITKTQINRILSKYCWGYIDG